MHTQAQQPHHLSCCPADTGTALSWSVTGGVGRSGVEQYGTITFMFLCTHRQAQRPHHLSCCPADTTTALSWSVTGGVGWDNNACSCTRTGTALRPPGAWWSSRLEICHANRPIFQNRQVPGTIHSKWVSWVEKKVSAQHGNHFLSSMAAWIGHPQSNEPPVLFENGACHVFPLTVWMKTPLPTH